MTLADTNVLVRPYERDDRAALMDLLREVWPHKHDIEAHVEDRWWWQHPEPPIMVAEQRSQRRLAGVCAFRPFTLVAHGAPVPAAWFVDFFVRSGCQGQGIGRRLTTSVQDRFAVTASLSQTDMAYRVFLKLGWRERMPVTMFMHPLPRRWLIRQPGGEHRIEMSSAGSAAGAASSLDDLWSRVQRSYPAVALRTGVQVLERFAAYGTRQYTLLRCFRGDACAGYMVVRPVRPLSGAGTARDGLIVDFLVAPDDAAAFQALLREGVGALVDAGVRRIYCVSTLPACRRVLASHGFLSPSTPLLGRRLRGNVKWLTVAAAPGAPQVDATAWHLTLGDCDLDQVWYQA
jgi:hypothetical protein